MLSISENFYHYLSTFSLKFRKSLRKLFFNDEKVQWCFLNLYTFEKFLVKFWSLSKILEEIRFNYLSFLSCFWTGSEGDRGSGLIIEIWCTKVVLVQLLVVKFLPDGNTGYVCHWQTRVITIYRNFPENFWKRYRNFCEHSLGNFE